MPGQHAFDIFVERALAVMEQLDKLVSNLLLINRTLDIRQAKHGTRR